jgi:hypothetical protein
MVMLTRAVFAVWRKDPVETGQSLPRTRSGVDPRFRHQGVVISRSDVAIHGATQAL